MAYTDKKVDLILNKLTKAQYDKLLEQNKISETELYFITDDNGKYILQGEVYTKEEIDEKLSKFYTQEQLTTLLGGKLDKTGGTITGDLTVNGTITASNISGGIAVIDDTQISTSSTYSSKKIDDTYLKLSTSVPIGTTLAVPNLTINTDENTNGSGNLQFTFKDTGNTDSYSSLSVENTGLLKYTSNGGPEKGNYYVATREWVNNKLSNTYKFQGSVDTYDDLPKVYDTTSGIGYVYNVKSNGANYAWTGTEWDELGATVNLDNYALKTDLNGKQDKLVSGTNIKTINGTSILGEGNIVLSSESGAAIDDSKVSTTSTYSSSKIDTTYAKSEDVYTKDEVFTKVEINESLSKYDTAFPTDIVVDANKMYLYHDGTAIAGQTPVEFKTVGGVSIFGSGNIEAGSSGGINVEANPTLYGSETELSGIKIGETSYKIPTPDLNNYALKSEVPEKVSDLPNDAGYTKTVVKFVKWED